MRRYGPESIEPAMNPDGLVVHIYAVPDGELLDYAAVDLGNVDAVTRIQGAKFGSRDVQLEFYDGDDGRRFAAVTYLPVP